MSSPDSSNNGSCSSSKSVDIYIYNLPLEDRNDLCAILDESEDVWSKLATEMQYSKADLQNIKRAVARGCSPSNELLHMWGDLNHTVNELFILLHRIGQYNAMNVIKSSVDEKYQSELIPDLANLMHKSKSVKILNCNNSSSGVSNSHNASGLYEGNSTPIAGDSKPDPNNWKTQNANEYASTIPHIDYKELSCATDNWSKKNILGSGGFGTVYRGTWKHTDVAIKLITYKSQDGGNAIQLQQSLNELKFLNSYRHDNILSIYGYSRNGDNPCLVYQLMPGGSLESRLKQSAQPLSWELRLHIACRTARGLQYLHTCHERPLIHGDIKPANILLDSCYEPKIGDFGLAREGPSQDTMEVSRVYGTQPYLPSEFRSHKKLSTKVDTFSFGVMLLEMFTGMRAFDNTREKKLLAEYILLLAQKNVPIEDLIYKTLRINADVEKLCKHVIELAILCISGKPEHRPEMVEVFTHLLNLQNQTL